MYAVIGAGPMGLACARNLDKNGIDFVGYELNDDVGGLWDIDNPHSTMYDSAHLISSKTMTEFREFPMADSVATYPHHSELKTYFQDYARAFGLYERFEFNTRVMAVEPERTGWRVTIRRHDQEQSRHVDGVLIANGTLHCPNRPELPGHFDGEILHASQYRHPEAFAGKRVLIVGCGNSACDMAVDAIHHASHVGLSVRRGYYFLPKFIAGKPIDTLGGKLRLPRRVKQMLDATLIRMVVGKPSDYGLPDPAYRIYESHPVVNSLVLHHLGHGDLTPHADIRDVDGHTVTFADGTAADYDLILLATGYKLDYPFIDQRHLNWNGADAPQLYLNALHPAYDNLFVMGMIEATGLGWEGRNEQAELVALYIRRLADNAASAKRLQTLKKTHAQDRADGGYNYLQLERMAYYVHKDSYLKAVRRQVRRLRADG